MKRIYKKILLFSLLLCTIFGTLLIANPNVKAVVGSHLPTDLTGYTVTVPPNWSVTSAYGYFRINYTLTLSGSDINNCSSLGLGFTPTDALSADVITYVSGTGTDDFTPENSFKIVVNGGDDATNSSLIQWFDDNNASFEKNETTPSIDLTGTTWVFNDILTTPEFVPLGETKIYNIHTSVNILFPEGFSYSFLLYNLDSILEASDLEIIDNNIEYVSGGSDNYIEAVASDLYIYRDSDRFLFYPVDSRRLDFPSGGANGFYPSNAPITTGTITFIFQGEEEVFTFSDIIAYLFLGAGEMYNSIYDSNPSVDSWQLVFSTTKCKTMTFTGGTDIDNLDFCSWVQETATFEGGVLEETKTINAGMYKFNETIIEPTFEGTFDLPTKVELELSSSTIIELNNALASEGLSIEVQDYFVSSTYDSWKISNEIQQNAEFCILAFNQTSLTVQPYDEVLYSLASTLLNPSEIYNSLYSTGVEQNFTYFTITEDTEVSAEFYECFTSNTTPYTPHVHTEEVLAAKEATCTETGLTEGKHCSVCNEILVAQTEIPALGHTFEEGKCTVCNADDPDYQQNNSGTTEENTLVITTSINNMEIHTQTIYYKTDKMLDYEPLNISSTSSLSLIDLSTIEFKNMNPDIATAVFRFGDQNIVLNYGEESEVIDLEGIYMLEVSINLKPGDTNEPGDWFDEEPVEDNSFIDWYKSLPLYAQMIFIFVVCAVVILIFIKK